MTESLEQQSFEESLKLLEKVVRALETGEVPLEKALDLFQTGIQLTKICSGKLDEAERKIQVLMEDQEGKLTLQTVVSLEEGA
ncbi:MAG TPA: exodeoxyribonuclease VII small subunit [Verrucomicrobiae bacterium]|nr:exodeoxyribonuclease VII small subunit [Verrucomicrobiae bacterium]